MTIKDFSKENFTPEILSTLIKHWNSIYTNMEFKSADSSPESTMMIEIIIEIGKGNNNPQNWSMVDENTKSKQLKKIKSDQDEI